MTDINLIKQQIVDALIPLNPEKIILVVTPTARQPKIVILIFV